MNERELKIEQSRVREIAYRRFGLFEAAVAQQRYADNLEAGGSLALNPAHIDRGATEGCDVFLMGSFLGVISGDGACCVLMTRDRAWRVFLGLMVFLEIQPGELRELSDALEFEHEDAPR